MKTTISSSLRKIYFLSIFQCLKVNWCGVVIFVLVFINSFTVNDESVKGPTTLENYQSRRSAMMQILHCSNNMIKLNEHYLVHEHEGIVRGKGNV